MAQGFTWNPSYEDPMTILVFDGENNVVLRIFLGEAMELAGSALVKAHVAECDRSDWVKNWHENLFAQKSKSWSSIKN